MAMAGKSVIACLLVAVGVICTLMCVGLLVLSAAPYELWLRLARLATGSANPLSSSQYSLFLPRLAPCGLFYGAVGLALLLLRRRLTVGLASAVEELRACAFFCRRSTVEWLRTESREHLAVLATFLLLGAILRVAYLDLPPRYDEAATYISNASRSIVHVVALYETPNNHVLHTLLVWVSCLLLGQAPWAWRIPALLAGVTLLLLVYVLGRRLGGRHAGLLAAGFAAVSGPLVLYSVNARGYMLQSVFFLVMLCMATELARGSPGGSWLLFSATTVAGFWTAPTMLHGYLIAAGWLLWSGGRRLLRPLIVSGVAAATAVVFLYTPVVLVSGPEALLRNPWVRPLPPTEFWLQAGRFPADLFSFLYGGDPLVLPLVLALGVALGLRWRTWPGRHRAQLLVLVLTVPLAVSAFQRVVVFPRVFLPLYAVYCIVSAAGWLDLRPTAARYRLAVSLASAGLLALAAFHLVRSGYVEAEARFYQPASRAITGLLARELRPGDRLVISLRIGTPLEVELRRAGVPYVLYSSREPLPHRLLVAHRPIEGPLPPRGNGLADPSVLTFEGTLRDAGVESDKFAAPCLVFAGGGGQVFEIVRRDVAAARLLAGTSSPACQP